MARQASLNASMTSPSPVVNQFLSTPRQWQQEFVLLRAIALGCGLDENFKWGWPCYTLEGKNIILLHGFKDYCAVLFFKGALIADDAGILIQQTKNVQSARQARYTSSIEISQSKVVLKKLILKAIEVERSGRQVALKEPEDFEMPTEFKDALATSKKLKAAFEALTPGRQRGYLLYFGAAKQSKTRLDRITKCSKRILAGKGLND